MELRALKLTYGVNTPIETDLLSIDPDTGHATLFLRPKETVLVPFKYVEMLPNSLPSAQSEVRSVRMDLQLMVDDQLFFSLSGASPSAGGRAVCVRVL